MIPLTGHLVICTLQVAHYLVMETVQVDVFQMFSTMVLQGNSNPNRTNTPRHILLTLSNKPSFVHPLLYPV